MQQSEHHQQQSVDSPQQSSSQMHLQQHQQMMAGLDFSLLMPQSSPKKSPNAHKSSYLGIVGSEASSRYPDSEAPSIYSNVDSPQQHRIALLHPNDMKVTSLRNQKCRKISAIVFGVLILGAAAFLAYHFVSINQPLKIPVIIPVAATFETMPTLQVVGKNVVYPNGTTFHGRGVNMGSWFIMDAIFSGFTGLDEFAFFNVSDTRWGQDTSRSLMNLYIDNAMTSTDYDLLCLMNFNFVRLPLHFRNFQDAQGNWINYTNSPSEIDFSRLDWAISNFTSRGIYVQLDFHIWYSRDILYEGVSKNDVGLATNDPALYAECVKWRQMAANFLTGLAAHVVDVPGLLGIELMNEPVPSYDNLLSQVLYDGVRVADPNRLVIRHFGTDRVAPSVYNWTNIIYGFHTYEGQQTLQGYEENANNKTSDDYDLPYYVSELHFTSDPDFAPAIDWTDALQNGVNIPMYALWTYKAVDMNEWALVNYDSSYTVDVINGTLESIQETWKRLPNLNLAGSLSPWGQSFIS
ncbi:hypothetical protein HK100_011794 [Physocladia obscura]|uniref:Glycoside hydrolase family 5 domain-containing protein n=1 Tax=Physocladia obscura TaxID=109957 RepID=A0AAD5T0Q6_9FUNG|nr:hypothetical protein HK100_011794 [Physocladia obscura]